jgi:hypothetical protein
METMLLKDTALPKIGKAILSKQRSGQITMDEFDYECAAWLMSYIEDMRWRVAPSEPEEIRQYNEKRNTENGFTLPPSFWQQQHIREWMATDRSVHSQNKSNWHWLHFLKKHIPGKDVEAHVKISKTMATYPRAEDKYVPKDDWRNR